MKCCLCKQEFVPRLNINTWTLQKCHALCLEYKQFLLDMEIKVLEDKLEKKYELNYTYQNYRKDIPRN
jgi:hypothetical protein